MWDSPAKKVTFQCHRKSKNSEFHRCQCKTRIFYRYFTCVWKPKQKYFDLLLDCKRINQHFATVTSVLQTLFVLRVMFRVYVYWSGSDTYPVFRTRFSPSVRCWPFLEIFIGGTHAWGDKPGKRTCAESARRRISGSEVSLRTALVRSKHREGQ